MKTILVPSDFSANAENALYYAIDLAKKENAGIVLLHAYQISYANAYVPYSTLVEEKELAEKLAQNELHLLELKIKYAGGINYESVIMEDAVVDAVLSVIKEKKVDLIVMGTKGATGLGAAIFGSNTAKVIEKATCPVIAVPEGATFKSFKKIIFATAYNQSDINGIKKIVEHAQPLNAEIQVLHISEQYQSAEWEKDLMKSFSDDVNKVISYPNISFRILRGDNLEEALQEYIGSDSATLLVMSTHRRGFFARLFGESVTRHMAYHSTTPLMALHADLRPVAVSL